MTDRAVTIDLFESETFLLRELEIYNWGPFAGLHRLPIDLAGTAIIGQTGSGKTTLVDAFTTLLVERPLYNLASTGGHESDRDLLSYVRGVSGAGNDSGDNAHIARPGATVTGLGARIASESASVYLCAIMAIDSTSSAVVDLRRIWLFDQSPDRSLTDWLELHHEDGFRGLRHFAKTQDVVHAVESKRGYLARVRRFFAVSDSAFDLLNRAAGLKQLNSIDELFRELVLDDHAAFGRAREVIDAFDDLKTIHAELEVARQQQASLEPIAREHKRWLKNDRSSRELAVQKALLPTWFAQHAVHLFTQRCDELQREIERLESAQRDLAQRLDAAQTRVETLHRIYVESGGGSIEDLKQQIVEHEREIVRVERDAEDYRRVCRSQDWAEAIERSTFEANQARAATAARATDTALAEGEPAHEKLAARAVDGEDKAARLEAELTGAKASPSSNIPIEFQRFKTALVDAVRVPVDEVAFVAELMEVADAERKWRGAIERALGAHRLRLVVPPQATRRALDWVNGRDNRLHVRLLDESADTGDGRFLHDGFCRKLNFKPHPRREAVKRLLAGIDRHCVDGAQLATIAHAMTREGLMSQRRGVFDKQDQRALDENWLTGFDNRDLVERLSAALDAARRDAAAARTEFETAKRALQLEQQKRLQLEQLAELSFETIDSRPATQRVEAARLRLDALLAPSSDAAKAEAKWLQAKAAAQQLQTDLRDAAAAAQTQQHELTRLESQRTVAVARMAEGLDAEQQALGDAAFRAPTADDIDHLSERERDAAAALQARLDTASAARAKNEIELGRLMERAQRADTGALAEAGTELEDVETYLDRLRVLTREALPQKQDRFLAYLNRSSDEGVTQLLRSIDAEVARIEERIDEINHTMQQVDFAQGQFLRLEPGKQKHERINALLRAQRQLASASLLDDMGESHFSALTAVIGILAEAVENSRRLASRALLDPRYRLRFSVSVIDRDTERVIENRTGSQGGSGGEKEIIASYILTASLSYALCPEGNNRPLFGTIVLDEAFSKSSMSVAARIIGALREFGLHALFVTPNKEMRLLRAHTRAAVLVHRAGAQSVCASMSWEELDEHARERLNRRREVSG